MSGLLEVDDAGMAAEERRYRIPDGCAEVYLDESSLSYLAPFARYTVGVIKPVDEVLDAFRTGRGVSADAYGDDVREAQAAANRPHFEQFLASEWLPAMPDVDARLRADPPARIAEIACGGGWARSRSPGRTRA